MGPATRYCYLALLFQQWREGFISADRKKLKHLLLFPLDPHNRAPGVIPDHYTEEIWNAEGENIDMDRILDQVLECFEQGDVRGTLVNCKLERIRAYHSAVSDAKSKAGKLGRMKQLGAQPRQTLGSQPGHSPASQSQSQSQITPKDVGPAERKKRVRADPPTIAWQGQLLKVTQPTADALKAAYPQIDTVHEYHKADAWMVAHPGKRKGTAAFINRWMAQAETHIESRRVGGGNGEFKTVQERRSERNRKIIDEGLRKFDPSYRPVDEDI